VEVRGVAEVVDDLEGGGLLALRRTGFTELTSTTG